MIEIDKDVPDIKTQSFFQGGYKIGMERLDAFIKTGLKSFAADRNDPTKNGTSRLSAWTHFGMISAQKILLKIKDSTFVEEFLVRRELSDNFCYYNKDGYDKLSSCPGWAQECHKEHAKDNHESLYSIEELEQGKTSDPLWNACMRRMIDEGYLNGYLRMYWGKQFLAWSKTPNEAVEKAIILNNRYFMDGRDPNSYVGILWCMGALHDRAFVSRPIFGKIRYMSFNGCKRKFDVSKFIEDTGSGEISKNRQKKLKIG